MRSAAAAEAREAGEAGRGEDGALPSRSSSSPAGTARRHAGRHEQVGARAGVAASRTLTAAGLLRLPQHLQALHAPTAPSAQHACSNQRLHAAAYQQAQRARLGGRTRERDCVCVRASRRHLLQLPLQHRHPLLQALHQLRLCRRVHLGPLRALRWRGEAVRS